MYTACSLFVYYMFVIKYFLPIIYFAEVFSVVLNACASPFRRSAVFDFQFLLRAFTTNKVYFIKSILYMHADFYTMGR